MKIEELFKYHPVYYTHDTYEAGGRKVHVKHEDSARCLCGLDAETRLFTEVFLKRPYDNIVAYLRQPDPGRNICQRCRDILIKMAKQ